MGGVLFRTPPSRYLLSWRDDAVLALAARYGDPLERLEGFPL